MSKHTNFSAVVLSAMVILSGGTSQASQPFSATNDGQITQLVDIIDLRTGRSIDQE